MTKPNSPQLGWEKRFDDRFGGIFRDNEYFWRGSIKEFISSLIKAEREGAVAQQDNLGRLLCQQGYKEGKKDQTEAFVKSLKENRLAAVEAFSKQVKATISERLALKAQALRVYAIIDQLVEEERGKNDK